MTIDPAVEAARKRRRHRNERIAAAILVLIVLIAAVAIRIWDRAGREALRSDPRYVPKEPIITPEVEMLREYVRIDTSTAKGVAKGARWLAAQLEKNGIRAELIESAPGHLNVYARVRGKQKGEGLLLLNHIDVVGANPAEWTHPPFAAEIHLNQLWGRGALDMKGIAICQLVALASVHAAGTPEHDIVFLATAEEEQGSNLGLKWLLAHRPDLFEGISYAITEGGITESIAERMVYFGIEVGSKQRVQIYLDGPDQESLLKARIELEPLMTARDTPRLIPEVRRFFHDVAPARIAMRSLLQDIDGAMAGGQTWRLPSGYRELLQNRMHVTAPWQEKVGWSMSVLMLNLPDENPDVLIERVRKIAEPFGILVRVDAKEGPVPSTDPGTPLFRSIAEEARKYFGVHTGTEVLYLSYSDCRHLRPLGIPCYGVSPFLADISQSLTIHRPNERIRIDWFQDGIGYFRQVLRVWATRP